MRFLAVLALLVISASTYAMEGKCFLGNQVVYKGKVTELSYLDNGLFSFKTASKKMMVIYGNCYFIE